MFLQLLTLLGALGMFLYGMNMMSPDFKKQLVIACANFLAP